MRKKRESYAVDRKVIEENAKGKPHLVFALTLNQLMIDNQVDQIQMAEATGISAGQISYYRNGQSEPKISSVLKIANYLNVDCHYLITGAKAEQQTAYKELGLNNDAIKNLSFMRYYHGEHNKFLNLFLSSRNFIFLLLGLEQIESAAAQVSKYTETKKARLQDVVKTGDQEKIDEEIDDIMSGERSVQAWREVDELGYAEYRLSESIKTIANEVFGYQKALKGFHDLRSYCVEITQKQLLVPPKE